jgi:hypothetical protein
MTNFVKFLANSLYENLELEFKGFIGNRRVNWCVGNYLHSMTSTHHTNFHGEMDLPRFSKASFYHQRRRGAYKACPID